MSIFKTNKFFRVIKHFILALPLMFVLGVSLYTIVNPNAKDSYYGDTINEKLEFQVSSSNLVAFTEYTFFPTDNYTSSTLKKFNIMVENVHDVLGVQRIAGTPTFTLVESDSMQFRLYTDLLQVEFHRGGDMNNFYYYYYGGTTSFQATFTYLSTFLDELDNDLLTFTYYEYNQYSYLNNAFEYGMYQFSNIGFGQFDFISLFNGIFTTNINNVYASFINDYINYYLFVEIVYFAPWVFHAFIHFAYDLGDYFTSSFKRNRKDDD